MTPSEPSGLPTARTTLRARYLDLSLHCRSASARATRTCRSSSDAGRGDVPLIHLRFRCSYCGHRGCDALVVPKERALGPRG